ncbi:MAG: hypothetical protein MJ247_00110 [Alphaproteobacteria bacterium]|nr:hypothetical protein [Alphaproteobacteria bacterium]
MSKKKIFCEKIFSKLLVGNSIKTLVEMLQMPLLLAIAGNLVGEQGISLINIYMPLQMLAMFFSVFNSIGSSYSYSEKIGDFGKIEANKIFGQGILVAFIIGFSIFLVAYFFNNFYLSLISPSEEILQINENFKLYFFLYLALLPINSILQNMICADGDYILLIVSSVVNVVCSLIAPFVFYTSFNCGALSLGLVIGLVCSAIVSLFHLIKKENTLKFVPYFNLKAIVSCLKLGLDDAWNYFTYAISSFLLIKFVILYFSEKYLPVLAVIMAIEDIISVLDSVGGAIAPLVEVYKAEKNATCMKKAMNVAFNIVFKEGIGFALFFAIFANWVPAIYDIKEPELIALTIYALRIRAFGCIFSSISPLFSAYYLMTGKYYLTFLITFSRNLFFRVVCIFSICLLFDFQQIAWGMLLSDFLTFVSISLLVYFKYGKKKFPYVLDEQSDDIYSFDLVLTNQNIVDLRDEVEKLLIEKNASKKNTLLIKLLVEELYCFIIEQNKDKKHIFAEFIIKFQDDGIVVVSRDDGKIFDVTVVDADLSFNAFVVSSIMEKFDSKKYLTTTGYNRRIFKFEK